MSTRKGQASEIIRNSATASAIASGALAQLPSVDDILWLPIVSKMVISLGELFGKHYEQDQISSIIKVILPASGGLFLATPILKFLPLVGNIINAAAMIAPVQAIGWGAYHALEDGKELTELTPREWAKYLKLAKQEKPTSLEK